VRLGQNSPQKQRAGEKSSDARKLRALALPLSVSLSPFPILSSQTSLKIKTQAMNRPNN